MGLNIGTAVTNLPSTSDIVSILKLHQITHIRLHNAEPRILRALSNSPIEVMVTVTNEEVVGIGKSPATAAAWVNRKIVPYVPLTNITSIAVGNEILTKVPHVAPALVPSMRNLHKALVASNLNFKIKVSAPQSMDLIPTPFPPSAAIFDSGLNSTIHQLLEFLKKTDSYYMLNAYPYYGYVAGNGVFPIDYALFRPLSRVKQIVDPNTLSRYVSMFDAMVDAAYFSIQVYNISEIPVVVTETGWPRMGGSSEPDATLDNAETFNTNLIRRVLNGSGPPSMYHIPINTYIYELFDEDNRAGPVSDRNWGVFSSNGTALYPLNLGISDQNSGNSSALFCVARHGTDTDKLRDGIDWACGEGHANCNVIQSGQPCYIPNTLENHASYAYNDYYQRMKSVGGSCDFGGTAVTTPVDPSKFPLKKNSIKVLPVGYLIYVSFSTFFSGHGTCTFSGR